jgi:hypothetical protein
MSQDWTDDPEFAEFAHNIREELLPKLRSSAAAVTIVSNHSADVKLAVETGFAILLDKPIIVAVTPGAKVPAKLAKVADRIVEIDLSTPAGRDKIAAAFNAVLAELDQR